MVEHQHHVTAVVRNDGVLHGHLLRTLHSVICRNHQIWCGGVLNRDGLNLRCGIAAIVGRCEGARDGVVTQGLGQGCVGDQIEGHRTTVVRSFSNLHRHVVGALHSVVCWEECEHRRSDVLNRNHVGVESTLSRTVLNLHGPCDGVVARAAAGLNHVAHVHYGQRTFASNGTGRTEVVTHSKVLTRWEVNLSVARHRLVPRRHLDGGASKCTHGTLLEGHFSSNVIVPWSVACRENLSRELSVDDTVCGQLGHQHAVVIASDGVHLTRRGNVPATTDGVIHKHICSVFEGIDPSSEG